MFPIRTSIVGGVLEFISIYKIFQDFLVDLFDYSAFLPQQTYTIKIQIRQLKVSLNTNRFNQSNKHVTRNYMYSFHFPKLLYNGNNIMVISCRSLTYCQLSIAKVTYYLFLSDYAFYKISPKQSYEGGGL